MTARPPIDWLFPIATLTPAGLILLAAVRGGAWAWAALASMTLLVYAMDALVARAAAARPPGAPEAEFPAPTLLAAGLGALHFLLLAAGLAALTGAAPLSPAQGVALFLALGLWLGQVSNSDAHELIHRPGRGLRRLGTWVYVSLLFGHHASAHPKVHHRWVGSPRDPNTARLGEAFPRFALRAWRGSFLAGLGAESALLRQRDGRVSPWRHPYALYLGGGLASALLVLALFGPAGLTCYLGLCLHAQAQLLLSDYVQHYGLERREIAPGRYEPVAAGHSWNAPHPFSSRLMLNAPRHSDHHARPALGFDRLTLPAGAPMLPRSLPVMATLALFPRAWRRVMDRRVLALRAARAAA